MFLRADNHVLLNSQQATALYGADWAADFGLGQIIWFDGFTYFAYTVVDGFTEYLELEPRNEVEPNSEVWPPTW